MKPVTDPINAKTSQAPKRKTRPLPLKTLALLLTAATMTAGSSLAIASHQNRGATFSSHSEWHSGSRYFNNGHHNRQNIRHNQRHRNQAFGRVVNVQPVYKQVQIRKPHKECWTEYQYHETSNGYNAPARLSQRRNRNASPLLGTIVGGAIGNQLGRYSASSEARIGATIAGALIGTVVGNESINRNGSSANRHNSRQHLTQHDGHVRDRFDRLNRWDRGVSNPQHDPGYSNQTSRTPVQRCTTRTRTTTENRLSGYRVAYRYQGRLYRTTTQQHPGKRIAVEVSVRPRY